MTVSVFDGGSVIKTVTSNGDGSYLLSGLPESTGYAVCFQAGSNTSGPSSAGYGAQCYRGADWNPSTAPPGAATPVAVTAGSTATGVDASLSTAGAISGTVTAAPDGAPLTQVTVEVFDADGQYVTQTSTAGDGTYTVLGLPASATGYTVCFDAAFASGGSAAGYRDQCYADAAWDGSSPPSGTAVPVTAGQTASGTDAALAPQ